VEVGRDRYGDEDPEDHDDDEQLDEGEPVLRCPAGSGRGWGTVGHGDLRGLGIGRHGAGISSRSWSTELLRLAVAFHFCSVDPSQASTSMADHASPLAGSVRPRQRSPLSTIVNLAEY